MNRAMMTVVTDTANNAVPCALDIADAIVSRPLSIVVVVGVAPGQDGLA